MMNLPTAAQINALTDVDALRALADDVERTVIQIETQLEHDVGDDDWALRAANALALFRYTERLLKRRLHRLTRRTPETRETLRRADADIHPLALRAMQDPAIVDPESLSTIEAVEASAAMLVETINAVEADRADEIDRRAGDRDEGFITRANTALRSLKALRVQLQTRRSTLTRAARQAVQAERNANRQQRFIDVARDILPPETYRAIWDRVLQDAA